MDLKSRRKRTANRLAREWHYAIKSALSQREKIRCKNLGAKWYDEYYKNDNIADYKMYHEGWDIVLSWIGNNERINDFGCGTGVFARYAMEHGKIYEHGYDYSKVAVEKARKLCPKAQFSQFDLYEIQRLYPAYEVAVFLEVFEHLKYDLRVVYKIPYGKRVIFSVPSFDCAGHYRHFSSIEEVVERYGKYLDVLNTAVANPDKKIWYVNAVRNRK